MVWTEMGLKMRVFPPDVTLKPLGTQGNQMGRNFFDGAVSQDRGAR